jgi:hypothetical protein
VSERLEETTVVAAEMAVLLYQSETGMLCDTRDSDVDEDNCVNGLATSAESMTVTDKTEVIEALASVV